MEGWAALAAYPPLRSSVKALRFAPTATRRAEGCAALTDASAAGGFRV